MDDAIDRARSVLAGLDDALPGIEELYRDLHTHPELSGQEERTAGLLAQRARAAGIGVTERLGGYGVVGLLANGPGPVVALRADLDALPIAEQTGLPYASHATAMRDGQPVPVMHACGHDLHTASLAGAAQLLAARREAWSGTLMLIGQPAEESMQGAKAMLAAGLFRDFPRPDAILGQHCATTRVGMVHHRAGPVYAACRNFRITVFGRGAHAAAPHHAVDPVVIAASLVLALQPVVSRETDPNEMAVLTVGSVHAGSRPNIIPPEAVLEVTLRARTEPVMDRLQAALERVSKGVCAAAGAPREPMLELLEQTYAVVNDDALTARVREVHSGLFPAADLVALPWANTASEDFAFYGVPGPDRYAGPPIPICMWFYGSTPPQVWDRASGDELRERVAQVPGQHTPFYAPDATPALRRGVEALVGAALAVLPGRAG